MDLNCEPDHNSGSYFSISIYELRIEIKLERTDEHTILQIKPYVFEHNFDIIEKKDKILKIYKIFLVSL